MIKFDKHQKEEIISELKKYCENELDLELGQFEAEFFFDFISEKMGSHFYNRGLQDAQDVVAGKMVDMGDAIDELSKAI